MDGIATTYDGRFETKCACADDDNSSPSDQYRRPENHPTEDGDNSDDDDQDYYKSRGRTRPRRPSKNTITTVDQTA